MERIESPFASLGEAFSGELFLSALRRDLMPQSVLDRPRVRLPGRGAHHRHLEHGDLVSERVPKRPLDARAHRRYKAGRDYTQALRGKTWQEFKAEGDPCSIDPATGLITLG